MSADWEETTLGEVCFRQHGSIQTGPFGSQLHTSDYQESGTPVVMPTNIADGIIDETGIARIGREDVNRLSQHILKKGDIIFSRRGDVTKNALVRARESGWFCGTGCLKVRIGNESIASAEFISQYLRLPIIKEWLIRHAVGATMPNLNTAILSAVPVLLPPLCKQEEIAKILNDFDKKITLNTQTNQTLESIAQAIFKSWFVDFEPVKAKIAAKERWYAMQPTSEPASPVCYADEAALPDLETYTNLAAMCAISGKNEAELAQLQQQNPDHYQQLAETAALFPSTMVDSELGEIPEGWEISTLGDLANLNEKSWTAKNAPPEIHYVDLANTKWGVINSVETYDYSRAPSRARRVLRRSDTIIGTVRPSNGSYAFVKASNLTGSTGFAVLSPREEIFAELIYIAATAPENIERLAHLADGGAYPSVRPEVVMGTPIVLPEKIDSLQDLCSIFSRSTASMFEKSFINQEENASLAKLRDSLLPKLLSGEIDLTEIQSEVA